MALTKEDKVVILKAIEVYASLKSREHLSTLDGAFRYTECHLARRAREIAEKVKVEL